MKKWLIVGSLVGLITLIGGGVYYFGFGQKAGINEVIPRTCPPGQQPVYNYNAKNQQVPPYCGAITTTTPTTSVAPSTSTSSTTGSTTQTGNSQQSGNTTQSTTQNANCQLRYYYSLETKSCTTTTRHYNDAEMDCDGGTGKTCVVNLQEWLPGKTAGSCFKTLAQCQASSGTVCSPRYYFNTQTKSCEATNRSYNAQGIDCDGQTNKSCTVNLGEWLPGKTTGVCYADYTTCYNANKTTGTGGTVTSSPSPSPSKTTTSAASIAPSPSPSPSQASSNTVTYSNASPSLNPGESLPDTTQGVPVTGVFEVTAGTLGIGILLLILGMLGLLLL